MVHFWLVDMVSHARDDIDESASLFLFPAARKQVDFEHFNSQVPELVLQYCQSAHDVYLSGNLTASNVLTKSALESIFFDLMPLGNSKTTLPKMIRESMDAFDLNQPLENLRSSLKPDGKLDKLFNEHQHADQSSADAMMKLLELLLEFLYVVPERFKTLEEVFDQIDRRRMSDTRAHDNNPSSADHRVSRAETGKNISDRSAGGQEKAA